LDIDDGAGGALRDPSRIAVMGLVAVAEHEHEGSVCGFEQDLGQVTFFSSGADGDGAHEVVVLVRTLWSSHF
jgi:hypothetical protein